MAQLSDTVINGSLSVNGNVSGKGIINLIYPIGSIYISVNSADPKTLFGIGTWVKLPSNYTLWSCDSGAYDGTNGTIAAGLPNITGWANNAMSDQSRNAYGGAFSVWEGGKGHPGGNYAWSSFNFDASRSSSIYGKSSTVQPPAIKVYMWRRIS